MIFAFASRGLMSPITMILNLLIEKVAYSRHGPTSHKSLHTPATTAYCHPCRRQRRWHRVPGSTWQQWFSRLSLGFLANETRSECFCFMRHMCNNMMAFMRHMAWKGSEKEVARKVARMDPSEHGSEKGSESETYDGFHETYGMER